MWRDIKEVYQSTDDTTRHNSDTDRALQHDYALTNTTIICIEISYHI